MNNLRAPFPYFGGKRTIAHIVWDKLGNPKRYIEPFFGSGAVLLNRPDKSNDEIINDKDGFVSNVWRALKDNPEEVAKFCDWPINHADLCARRKYLISQESILLAGLINDDEWYDVKCAGYWIWAASSWIGSGLTKPGAIPDLTVRKGVNKICQSPQITGEQGIHQIGKRPHLGGKGINIINENLYEWFRKLSDRLRYVKVVCGDWTRVCGGDWQDYKGNVGIFFDPPYSTGLRDDRIYHKDTTDVAQEVNKWCLERGKRKTHRIVLAGYEGEHDNLQDEGWEVIEWKAGGGYGNVSGNKNRKKERLWVSPHCVPSRQLDMFRTVDYD